jgi:uncharacterized protein YdeI (YjbR/CyaY-like superfamily)
MAEKRVYAKNRREWRAWLRKNHDKETKIHLIKYKKHTGKPSLSHKESMEEAICFGWIDTIVKRIDEETYLRGFVKRNENSRWSNATLSYAKRLIKEKRMAPAGLRMYKLGLKKPTIDFILPKNHRAIELEKELNKNKSAKLFFDNLAPSYKRNYIRWIERAKRPETKAKRISTVIAKCSQNKKL